MRRGSAQTGHRIRLVQQIGSCTAAGRCPLLFFSSLFVLSFHLPISSHLIFHIQRTDFRKIFILARLSMHAQFVCSIAFIDLRLLKRRAIFRPLYCIKYFKCEYSVIILAQHVCNYRLHIVAIRIFRHWWLLLSHDESVIEMFAARNRLECFELGLPMT